MPPNSLLRSCSVLCGRMDIFVVHPSSNVAPPNCAQECSTQILHQCNFCHPRLCRGVHRANAYQFNKKCFFLIPPSISPLPREIYQASSLDAYPTVLINGFKCCLVVRFSRVWNYVPCTLPPTSSPALFCYGQRLKGQWV